MEPNQSLEKGQNLSFVGLCEGRENRGSPLIAEAPDSMRGLSRVQYLSGVNGKGYEWWLKAWAGTGWIVEVKQTPERSKTLPSEGLGREAKIEGLGLPQRCVMVGEVPTGSNVN